MNAKPKPRKREEIANDLRRAIQAGDIQPGDPLPTMGEIQKQYGCTIGTTQAAVAILRREGLVEGGGQGRRTRVAKQRPIISRSGAYVTPDGDGRRQTWRQEMAALGMTGDQTLGRVGETPAPDHVADLLNVEPGAPVLVRPRVMLADGEPVQLADTYYPLDLASGTDLAQQKLTRAGLLYQILDAAGLEVERCEEEVTFPMPTPEQERALNLASGERVVWQMRVLYVTGPRVASVDIATLKADRHRLVYSISVHH